MYDHYGWFSIRSNDEWALELPVVMKRTFLGFTRASFLAGTFIAMAPIVSYVTSHLDEMTFRLDASPHIGFLIIASASLLSGWIAAATVMLSLPRMRP